MTASEELEIDVHLLRASNLRTTSIGYKAFERLLLNGRLSSDSLGSDYTLFVNFTKVLDHLQLEYQFITGGLALKENAKENYRQNVMLRRHQPVKIYRTNERQRVGKDEPEENKIGWCDRKLSDTNT
ncbi:hypothetical protein [Flavobacterium johnsoniae]|uniref:Uncharacterized protein n=1 Tax=Flavobacterium johnsoniae TaxID=986 RepID=A0A1M5VK52_FLAJO|nr:hypothetical protein [Flavobacterium johnsoniae]SHH75444.1 hypothetical protein SAMN05444388_11818 [Flavobacterium johnsoniae]